MTKLNKLLANLGVFNMKAYNLHWNMKGPHFLPLHKITEELFEGLTELMDDVAEKVAMQGDLALATFAAYLEHSTIVEIEPKDFSLDEVVDTVVADLDTLQKVTTEVEGTDVVQPLLDEVYLFIDKYRWIFKSHK